MTIVVQKIKTQISRSHFLPKIVPFIKWQNSVEPGRPQMVICRIRIACWVPNATNTVSECVILITFPFTKLNYECASMFVICTEPVMLYLATVGH